MSCNYITNPQKSEGLRDKNKEKMDSLPHALLISYSIPSGHARLSLQTRVFSLVGSGPGSPRPSILLHLIALTIGFAYNILIRVPITCIMETILI